MWLQKMKMNVAVVSFTITAFLSLNVMAENNEAGKEAVIRTESKVVDAWQVVCNYGKNNQKLGCAAILKITQKTVVKAGNEKLQESVAMLWSISKSPDGRFISTLQTPTGTMIQPGVKLKIANAPAMTLPYVSCNQKTCFASTLIDDGFLKQITSEQNVDVMVQAIDGKVYTYSFSSKGIDMAIQAIK